MDRVGGGIMVELRDEQESIEAINTKLEDFREAARGCHAVFEGQSASACVITDFDQFAPLRSALRIKKEDTEVQKVAVTFIRQPKE